MVLALAIGIFLSANVLFTILGGGTIVSFYQYAGQPSESGCTPAWWDSNKMSSSNTVILGDYKFDITKYNRRASISCKACSGTPTGEFDEYGCTVYNQTVPVYVNTYVKEVCYNTGGCYSIAGPGVHFNAETGYSSYYGGPICDFNRPENILNGYGTYWYHCVKVQTGTKVVECKGVDVVTTWSTSYTANIYKNDVLIETIGKVFYDSASTQYGSYTWEDDEIRVQFGSQSWYENSNHYSMLSRYDLKLPETAFSFEIRPPTQSVYIKGESAIIEVSVFNMYMNNIITDITTTICQPVWHGQSCEDLTQRHTLPLGETIIQYEIPTDFVVEKIDATPKITVYFDMNSMAISGVNIEPSKVIMDLDTMQTCSQQLLGRTTLTNVDLCRGYIPLGSVLGDTKLIQVAPKPLYMEMDGGICVDTDYKPSYNDAYCVLKGITDLTCVQLGCPSIEGHEYACTSAGICAETVYVTVWGTCPEGTTPTTTSEGEKICIKTEIAEVILQCDMSTIPPAICEGITAVCVDNLWVFEGKCIAQPTVPSHLSLWDQIKTWLNWDKFWLTVMGKLGY